MAASSSSSAGLDVSAIKGAVAIVLGLVGLVLVAIHCCRRLTRNNKARNVYVEFGVSQVVSFGPCFLAKPELVISSVVTFKLTSM